LLGAAPSAQGTAQGARDDPVLSAQLNDCVLCDRSVDDGHVGAKGKIEMGKGWAGLCDTAR